MAAGPPDSFHVPANWGDAAPDAGPIVVHPGAARHTARAALSEIAKRHFRFHAGPQCPQCAFPLEDLTSQAAENSGEHVAAALVPDEIEPPPKESEDGLPRAVFWNRGDSKFPLVLLRFRNHPEGPARCVFEAYLYLGTERRYRCDLRQHVRASSMIALTSLSPEQLQHLAELLFVEIQSFDGAAGEKISAVIDESMIADLPDSTVEYLQSVAEHLRHSTPGWPKKGRELHASAVTAAYGGKRAPKVADYWNCPDAPKRDYALVHFEPVAAAQPESALRRPAPSVRPQASRPESAAGGPLEEHRGRADAPQHVEREPRRSPLGPELDPATLYAAALEVTSFKPGTVPSYRPDEAGGGVPSLANARHFKAAPAARATTDLRKLLQAIDARKHEISKSVAKKYVQVMLVTAQLLGKEPEFHDKKLGIDWRRNYAAHNDLLAYFLNYTKENLPQRKGRK